MASRTRLNLLKSLLFLLLFSLAVYLFGFLYSVPATFIGRSEAVPVLLNFPKQALPTKSGYLSINRTSISATFYAFYEAESPISSVPQTPLIVWLQGGPGCTSMYGNFMEFGPWIVKNDQHHLQRNPSSWNKNFGLLFLDNPIGSGFSVAANVEEIPRDSLSVAKHLYIAINRFMEQNPFFRSRPLYIAGESYAGKYVPAIGYYILKKNDVQSEPRRINLAGIAIGNGLIDPVTQVETHALNAYSSGLINERQKQKLEELQSEAVKLAKMGRWGEATEKRYAVIDSLQEMSGLATLFDFTKKAPYKVQTVTDYLQKNVVKRALRAKESVRLDRCNVGVQIALHDDTMKSVKYMVEFVIRKRTKVLLYQGQFDLWDGVAATEAWVKTMNWEGIGNFLMAKRMVWHDDANEELVGYVQKWQNFSNVVISRAGHLVPVDQPSHSQTLIQDWVLDQGFFQRGDAYFVANLFD